VLKIVVITLISIVLVVLAVAIGVLYKSDLTRKDLGIYITDASKFVTLENGATMHYRDEGNPSGPELVLIHGGFGSLHNWEGWVKHLRQDYRVVSMDLLGHGLTGDYPANIYTRIAERDAVHMLLDELGIEQYVAGGNSFGGGIALELALEYPDEAQALVLVDSEGIPNAEDGYDASRFTDEQPTAPDDPSYASVSWLEGFGAKFIGPTVVRRALDSLIHNKDLLTDEFVDYYGRILRYKGNRESQILMFRQGLHMIATGDPQDLLPRLREIGCPTLVMQGEKDNLVPMRVSEQFAELISISELSVVPETGHMPMIEKPAETALVLKEFLTNYGID